MDLLAPPDATTLQALRISELRYRRLFETAQDGILILDADTGRIVDANPFLLKLLGYAREQLAGKQLWEIGFFKDRALSEAAFATLQKVGYIRYENLPLESQDGRRREVEFVSNLYEVGHERVIQCNIRDITDRVRLEAKLLQVQKMEAVGQLAGGVAHDFNNILTSTLLQLSMLLEDPNLPEGAKSTVRELELEAKRAAGLTRQLLLFSRKQSLRLRIVDLNEVMSRLLDMLRRLLSEDVQLDYPAGGDPLWIEADTVMIEQIITNLCLNAQDAMAPRGGRLLVEAKVVEIDAAAVQVNPEAISGSFACISVIDTGCGMSAATLEHIFEPFFTTKGIGEGTGLGLSTIYGIVKQHKGWVEVASQLGRGTTFRVFIPAKAKGRPSRPKSPRPDIRSGNETILLVDDEKAIREIVAQGLKRYGYRVFEASDGLEAVKVWAEHAGEIDLLFSDMRMPGGLTGMDLFERFHGTKATLKGVISSGYSIDEFMRSRDVMVPGLVFLPKPYNVKTLGETVRGCLDGVDTTCSANP